MEAGPGLSHRDRPAADGGWRCCLLPPLPPLRSNTDKPTRTLRPPPTHTHTHTLPPLHPPRAPQSKLALYTARYQLVLQRLRRNPLFRPPAWRALAGAHGGPGPECALSELKALAGLTGQTRYVCGFLTQASKGAAPPAAGGRLGGRLSVFCWDGEGRAHRPAQASRAALWVGSWA